MAALLGALLIPLFIASWRITLLGLSCQGLLMAWMAFRRDADPISVHGCLTLIDLALIRGMILPVALYGVLSSQNTPNRINVISANLLSWTFSLGIVLLAFNFSDLLADGESETRYVVAIVASGVMLGLQILSTPSPGIFSQMIGALYIENAIAFSEHGSEAGSEPIASRLAQIIVVALTYLLYRWYLMTVPADAHAEIPEAREGSTL